MVPGKPRRGVERQTRIGDQPRTHAGFPERARHIAIEVDNATRPAQEVDQPFRVFDPRRLVDKAPHIDNGLDVIRLDRCVLGALLL